MVGKVVNFNPRAREGSDDCCRLFGYLRQNFNPRSREGSDKTTGADRPEPINFNPRSREGSDTIYSQIFTTRRISIRAPARGATRLGGILYRLGEFQSALPRGERHSKINATHSIVISIRAPARGATGSHHATERRFYHFNPRSREGSDQ